jgi:hypothetical protein
VLSIKTPSRPTAITAAYLLLRLRADVHVVLTVAIVSVSDGQLIVEHRVGNLRLHIREAYRAGPAVSGCARGPRQTQQQWRPGKQTLTAFLFSSWRFLYAALPSLAARLLALPAATPAFPAPLPTAAPIFAPTTAACSTCSESTSIGLAGIVAESCVQQVRRPHAQPQVAHPALLLCPVAAAPAARHPPGRAGPPARRCLADTV